jgi:Flp pilus assembly pilin Flp
MSRDLVTRLRLFVRHEGALSITEYGMLTAFIALVLIAVVVILGGGLANWFGTKTGNITTV